MPQRAVLLDNIRSLLNVGAIFRTADGAGYDRVYLAGITPTPPRREISKTALGAEEWVWWEYYRDPVEVVDRLRAEGWLVVALEQTPDSTDYRAFVPPPDRDLCVVVGNEIDGVSPEVLSRADRCVELPMRGRKKSLNVATSAGILMYAYGPAEESLRSSISSMMP